MIMLSESDGDTIQIQYVYNTQYKIACILLVHFHYVLY